MRSVISSRTAAFKRRRRCSPDSTAWSRSSASVSSSARSASRVTRNGLHDTISMPGKSFCACAEISCSIGRKPAPSGSAIQRENSGGTLMRAKRCTWVSGSRTTTARFSDRFEM
jgi:hypothetical protein